MSPPAKLVTIDLLEAGCAIALSPPVLDQLTLSPEIRAVIENTPLDPTRTGRSFQLHRAEAEALREFFLTMGDYFSLHGNGQKTTACAEAAENIRHALWLAT